MNVREKRILWIDTSLKRSDVGVCPKESIAYQLYDLIFGNFDYEFVLCEDLRDLDQTLNHLNQKFDLAITEILFTPQPEDKSKPKKNLGLKGEEYCKAGITFVIPKLIECGLNFIIFSDIMGSCEKELEEIMNENHYKGSLKKIDYVRSQFLEMIKKALD